jgi:cation diffusion facilitator family transporter
MASGSAEKPIVIYAALAANIAIAVTKFAAAIASGSSAMLAEGVHSSVDTINEGLMLLGIRQSRKPPNAKHPFGHGKELYFWSLIVAMLILGAGGGVSIYEGVERLRHPAPLQDAGWAYIVLGAAFAFESASWVVAFRQFLPSVRDTGFMAALRHSKDPTLTTILVEDSAALVGILIAAAGILLSHRIGDSRPDAMASILIGSLLAGLALFLARESRGLLVGEAADPAVVAHIRELANAEPSIREVWPPLTMHLGPEEVLVNLSLRFHKGFSGEHVVETVARLERAIRRLHPEVTRIFVEAESRDGPSVEGPEPTPAV